MFVTIRLYRQHDMDLISLYNMKDFKFLKKMKSALIAYSKKEDYPINIPSFRVVPGYIKYITVMHIKLDEKKDAEAIKVLTSMKPGLRNSFLKAMFRNYLTNIPLTSYENNDDGLIFLKRTESINKQPKSDTVKVKKEISEKIKEYKIKEKSSNISTVDMPDIRKPNYRLYQDSVVTNFDLDKQNKKAKKKESENLNNNDADDFDLTSAFEDLINE